MFKVRELLYLIIKSITKVFSFQILSVQLWIRTLDPSLLNKSSLITKEA